MHSPLATSVLVPATIHQSVPLDSSKTTPFQSNQKCSWKVSAKGKQTAVINENHPTAWQDVKATIKVETKAMVGLKGKDAQKIESELPSAHQHAVTFYIDKLLHRIENKQVPVIEKGAQIDPKDELRRILDISNWGMDKSQIVVRKWYVYPV